MEGDEAAADMDTASIDPASIVAGPHVRFDQIEPCQMEKDGHFCQRRFLQLSNLLNHVSHEHVADRIALDFAEVMAASGTEKGHFECTLCGRKMAFRSSLVLHFGNHHGGAVIYLPSGQREKVQTMREALRGKIKLDSEGQLKRAGRRAGSTAKAAKAEQPTLHREPCGVRGSARLRGRQSRTADDNAVEAKAPQSFSCPECPFFNDRADNLLGHLVENHLAYDIEDDCREELERSQASSPDGGDGFNCCLCGLAAEDKTAMLTHLALAHDKIVPHLTDPELRRQQAMLSLSWPGEEDEGEASKKRIKLEPSEEEKQAAAAIAVVNQPPSEVLAQVPDPYVEPTSNPTEAIPQHY